MSDPKMMLMAQMLRQREPRLTVNGGVSDFDAGRGYAGGGRLGASVPLSDDSNVNFGIAGSAVKGPGVNQAQIEGADVSYSNGPNTVGLNWNRPRPGVGPMFNLENPFNPQSLPPNWMLTYRRQF